MSILDGQAVPTRVVAVLRALHRAGAADRTAAELMAVMLPDAVRLLDHDGNVGDNTMVPDSLAVAAALGLAEPGGRAGAYRLSADGRALGDPVADGYTDRCTTELARRLVGPQADGVGHQYRFLRWAWAWYLDLRPEEVPNDSDKFFQAIAAIREPGYNAANSVPYKQILHWGEAVGLLVTLELKTPGAKAQKVVMADPTPFLRRHLGDFMKPNQEVPVRNWVNGLAEKFPVFDHGKLRTAVRAARGKSPLQQEFSPSLELALRSLRDEGVLDWQAQTDSDTYFLTLGVQEPVAFLTYQP